MHVHAILQIVCGNQITDCNVEALAGNFAKEWTV